MTRYSVQPRDGIFVKGMDFLSFAIKIGKSKIKNLSGKYSQKLLDHAKQSATDPLKTTSKRAIKKTAEATGGLIGIKLVDKVSKFSSILPHINLEAVTNEEESIGFDRQIPNDLRWI